MEEQTIQQPTVNSEPETQPDYQEPAQGQESSVAEQEPEISIDEDGEVNFRKDFFGDLKDEPEPEPQPSAPEPNYYSDDELMNTPYEQWDINRLNGDIKKFVPIVQKQIAQRNAVQQISEKSSMPPYIAQPKDLDAKELQAEAQKLAIKNLGLDSEEEFDSYDPEHRAAYELAMQETVEKRQAAVTNYQKQALEYQDLQKFNISLINKPDFQEFSNWYMERLREKKLTPQQIELGFVEYIQKGGSFKDLQGVIANWYKDFQASRTHQPQKPKVSRPPVLENSLGAVDEGQRAVNFKNVGEMDTDGVAKFLMNNGYV